jgi:hypothetical protein
MVVAFVVPADPAAPPTLKSVFDHCRAAGLMTQKIPSGSRSSRSCPATRAARFPKHELRATIV